ncbi:MAG: DUF1385 domain-containing protein [Actinomycetota bacterium]|jgi:uncharacterized protein YqhQ|nr:DUF1385 domain-containing protein [Actinomycetota bacterium]
MPIKHTHIGGQAVLEGVMMRGKKNWAVAVREPNGSIYLEEHELKTAVTDHPWLGKPIIRGIWGMYETLVLAMKAFGISAEHAGETEDEQLSGKEIAFTMIAGVGLAVGLFIVLPAVVTNLMVGQATEKPLTWNVVDGGLRVVAFFLYIWAISRMKDIQRVFSYHGAEHKTIHAYESGLPLEVGSIQKFTTMHVRCGTSFLLMVMIIAIIVFSVVPVKPIVAALGVDGKIFTLLVAISLRIILMPLIAGLAYEVIKWAGGHSESLPVKVLLWPGLQLQRMTTREPEDDMIEVAVASMKAVIAVEEGREVDINEILGLSFEADDSTEATEAAVDETVSVTDVSAEPAQ